MINQGMSLPLISIGVPTINRAKLLSECLRSCLNQTYENIEIVISDNASSDNTEETIMSIDDNRIRYHRQSTTIPAIDNWNFCINKAEGKFFTFVSDDDILEPEYVKKLFELTITYPLASLWRSGLRSIDTDNNILWEFSGFSEFITPVKFIEERVMYDTPQFLPGFLCLTENMKKIGGFKDVGFPGALYSDDYFWFRLALLGEGVASTNQILWNYRTHLNHMGARIDIEQFNKNIPKYINILKTLISSMENISELTDFIQKQYPTKLISSRLRIEMKRDSRRSKFEYIQKLPLYFKQIKKYNTTIRNREILKNLL